MKYRIFISSVQREFARERKALADYIRRDALLGRFFEVFIFEETPAASDSAQKMYLGEAKDCDVYLGLIGAVQTRAVIGKLWRSEQWQRNQANWRR